MKTIIKEASKGNYNIRLSSQEVTLADGTIYTEYLLTRLHKNRVTSYGDMSKTYKREDTAIKNFDLLTQ